MFSGIHDDSFRKGDLRVIDRLIFRMTGFCIIGSFRLQQGLFRLFIALQYRFDFCQQNTQGKRLFYIIVAADIKSYQNIIITASRTDEKYRHIIVFPYPLAQIKT